MMTEGIDADKITAWFENAVPELKAPLTFSLIAGHWGVPTFVINGEPFFGQDRIETICWHMNGLGLKKKD